MLLSHLTLSKGWLAILAAVIIFLALVEMAGAFGRNRFFIKTGVDVSCEAGEAFVSTLDGRVHLKLRCGEKQLSIGDQKIVASVINNQGELMCTLYGDRKSVVCKPRP